MKYSIVLPVYNGGDLFKLCVESILNINRTDFQLHVLDNCSSDGSIEWLIALGDKRVEVLRSEAPSTIEINWGRIRALRKNGFMTMIGHDDLLHRNYLDVMDSLIEKHPDATLYQVHFRYIDINGELIMPCKPMAEKIYAHQFLYHQIKKSLDSTGTGYMMKSADYDELGGISSSYPNLIFADYELWMKLISLGYLACSDKECFSYRLHLSTSAITNGEQYQEAFEKYILFLGSAQQRDKQIKDVINELGTEFMFDNCESLSHRLLKTDLSKRRTSVRQFIRKCIKLSKYLMPEKSFAPMRRMRILLALVLDNSLGRKLFFLLKRKMY